MTTIARLARAELRKLVASRTFLIGLVLAVGLAVISVALDAVVAGKNGQPALGTAADTNQMLKLGIICCLAMLVLGILGSGSEYRHKTIIPAVLIAPRRGALVAAKVIGIIVAGVVLSTATFGLGLATAVAELSAHHIHTLPTDTGTLFAGSVISGTLFGVIGVALGYITRSTVAAVVGAVGWVLFVETIIVHIVAPHLAKWLISGAASAMTDPGDLASKALTPATAVAVLSAYAVVLVAVASGLVLRRDVA
jgi:ABC-type transport system involved in multi-copper enzyme maturation permease subunit